MLIDRPLPQCAGRHTRLTHRVRGAVETRAPGSPGPRQATGSRPTSGPRAARDRSVHHLPRNGPQQRSRSHRDSARKQTATAYLFFVVIILFHITVKYIRSYFVLSVSPCRLCDRPVQNDVVQAFLHPPGSWK